MKPLLMFTISFLLISWTMGQKMEKYYDHKWNPSEPNAAIFYSTIEYTDSGWNRMDYYWRQRTAQMTGTYEDSSCKIPNGAFYYFHPNGKISSYGQYLHGKKEGTWISIYDNGMLEDSSVYHQGNKTGISLSYYKSGHPRDSSVTTENGDVTAVAWFENGNLGSAGRYIQWNIPVKTWKYFHSNGQLSSIEKYANGKLMGKTYFDESGLPMDTLNHDRKAEYPGGVDEWLRYLQKNLYFPSQYKFENGVRAITIVGFTINTDGKITDVQVVTPFHPAFDRIAVRTIQNCKTVWLPTIDHNRKIPYQLTQPVYFQQKDR